MGAGKESAEIKMTLEVYCRRRVVTFIIASEAT